MERPRAALPLLTHERSKRSVSAAAGCAVLAVFAGLPFVYVASFVVLMLAYPFLDPRTTGPLHDFYRPLIWLSLQGETVQRWIMEL